MQNPQFIKHNGRRILYIDFSNATLDQKEELRLVILASRKAISIHPPNSLLILTNVHNTKYDTEIAQVMKEYVAHNKPFVKKSAIVGLSGLQIVLYNTIMRFTGRQLSCFENEIKAKDWLVAE